jgi:hypothetical protein
MSRHLADRIANVRAKDPAVDLKAAYPPIAKVEEKQPVIEAKAPPVDQVVVEIKEEKIKFDHIEPHRISWAGVPDANTQEIWAKIPYDILLCLHTKPCKPLEYLASISIAKCNRAYSCQREV